MAFQIDPNIPLQAGKVQFDPAAILMQAQQNGAALEKHRFEMQKLREDYDLAKEKRKQEKAMQMGIASDLAGIQSGSPVQYAPTRFEQTPQRGQMPQGMTGVMMREQGQQMPQPQAFGEEILNGDFRLGGGEVTQEAVAGREPGYLEMLKIGYKNAAMNQDIDSAFKFGNLIKQAEIAESEQNAPIGNPYPVYDTQGNFVGTRIMTKDRKEIPFGTDGTTTVKPDVISAKDKYNRQFDEKKLAAELAQRERESNRRIAAEANKPDPVERALAIAEGRAIIAEKSEQRKKVAEKYADSEAIEPILKQLITQLGKIPKTGFTRDIQNMVEYFGAGDEEAQNAIAEVVNTSALLVPFAQKQSGPQSDKDVQQYKEQVAAASNPLASASSRMAAAKNALMFAQKVKAKFGNYASDILSGKVTPEELQEKPIQPTKPTLDEKFQAMKEYKANRAKYAKDPVALKILDDKARQLGLIK